MHYSASSRSLGLKRLNVDTSLQNNQASNNDSGSHAESERSHNLYFSSKPNPLSSTSSAIARLRASKLSISHLSNAKLVTGTDISVVAPLSLEGFILKNRKWPMKGWHKRYFRLDSGILIYARTQNMVLQNRDAIRVDLGNTCVSAVTPRNIIYVDSTVAIYRLKFKETGTFNQWLEAIREHRLYSQRKLASLLSNKDLRSQLVSDGTCSTSSSRDSHISSLTRQPMTEPCPSISEEVDFDQINFNETLKKLGISLTELKNLQNQLKCQMELFRWSDVRSQSQPINSEVHTARAHDRIASETESSPTELFDSISLDDTNRSPNCQSSLSSLRSLHTAIQSPYASGTNSQLRTFVERAENFCECASTVYDDLDLLSVQLNVARRTSCQPNGGYPSGAIKNPKLVKLKPSSARNSLFIPLADDFYAEGNRRRSLPVPRPSNAGQNLFSILKNNIGRDLSKVRLPVSFNEPLSALQHICEQMEYSELLDFSTKLADPIERLFYIAAFAVSGYASSCERAGTKPFNPLLGETFEYIKPEKGWRFLAEQVSHHPPISVCNCSSENWILEGEMSVKTKFWGKSLEIIPIGGYKVTFKKLNEVYTWNNVTTGISGLFSTQRHVEHYGDMQINCDSGVVCCVKFHKSSSWGNDIERRVTGTLQSNSSRVIRDYSLSGRWDEGLSLIKDGCNECCIWRSTPLPESSASNYGFSHFAIELNEPPPQEWVSSGRLPNTDSRLRLDQRLLENGRLEEAEAEKSRLEDAQRQRLESKSTEDWQPVWFRRLNQTSYPTYKFTEVYWNHRDRSSFNSVNLPNLW